MKRLESAMSSDGIAELEVIECDCGYHMGIDASFVSQVDDAFFERPTVCPSCENIIPVRDLLEMEPMKVLIEIERSCSAYRSVEVEANSLGKANLEALDKAGDYEFSEKDADYHATGGWYPKFE